MSQAAKYVRDVAGEIRDAVAAFDKAADPTDRLRAMDDLDALGFGSAAVAEMVADTMTLSADAADFSKTSGPSLRRTLAIANAVRGHWAERASRDMFVPFH